MNPDKEKLARAKEILRKMANGINPINDEQIGGDSFLHDPRMVRCLYFVLEILDCAIEGPIRTGVKKPSAFVITIEEKKRIELPQERIGVNEFAKCVNKVLDLNRSKTLSGMEINKKLKKMGILGEEALPDGKKRTVLTARSYDHGVETEKRNYNGNEYEMVLFNEKGKKFLLDNLETIMEIDA
ncbi:MAG TPA: hypothetical protein VFG19_02430 [Geobacteraceae bacterium]|nr:hypothetical protein [Geobacteraceae bacterium]